MSIKNKLYNLIINPKIYAEDFAKTKIKISKIKIKINFSVFLAASIISILSVLILSILSTLKLGKYWIFNDDFINGQTQNQEQITQITNLLNNYIYIVNSINATVSLIGAIVSFFSFKDGYLKNKQYFKKMTNEYFIYENKIGKYFNLNEKEAKVLLINNFFNILEIKTSINTDLNIYINKDNNCSNSKTTNNNLNISSNNYLNQNENKN